MSTHFLLMLQALKQNNAVDALHFKNNGIEDQLVVELAEILKQNDTVRVVDLGYNDIGDEGAKAIAEMLKQNKTLHTLDLYWNNIGVEGAKAIAEMLKQNKTLQTLNLGSNGIGDEGASAVAEALKKNNTVRAVNLRGNGISAKGAEALAKMLKKNSTLQELILYFNFDNFRQTEQGSIMGAMFIDSLKKNFSLLKLGLNPGIVIKRTLERNELLQWSFVDSRFQFIFIGLHGMFGNDVYTLLLVLEQIPYFEFLNRSRKVALLQSFIRVLQSRHRE